MKSNKLFNQIIFGLIILGLTFNCTPQKESTPAITKLKEIEYALPESVGFNADSLNKIETMVNKYVDLGFIPGGVILIARHGKVIYEKAIGWNNIEAQEKYTIDNQFRLASMTKPITSVAIMQLYEKGKLDLQDPLSKYIPEFSDPMVLTAFNAEDTTWESRSAKREVTIHHLLTHTSGVSYGFMSPQAFGPIYAKNGVPDGANYLDLSLEKKMALLGKSPLAFDPGEKWSYGLSTDVLGRVVEVASGMSLDDYTSQYITEPLGMNETKYFFKDTLSHKVVSLYVPLGDTAIIEMKHKDGMPVSPDFPFRGAKKYLSGGSGLNGTARDYFVFAQTILDGGSWGDVRILEEKTVSDMMSNQIDTVSYFLKEGKFGYGLQVITENGSDIRNQRIGRSSWGGIFHTMFWIDPARDIVAIMMSQVLSNPNKSRIDAEFESIVNNALVDESK
jgi:CubicO group peptidase (beta-lactamase class C family)